MDQSSSNKICGLNRNIFFTGLVSFFMDFSSEMVYPLVPLFLSSVLGVHKSVIGLIEGIAESTASLLKVFSGWLSDRLGHSKWLMVPGIRDLHPEPSSDRHGPQLGTGPGFPFYGSFRQGDP